MGWMVSGHQAHRPVPEAARTSTVDATPDGAHGAMASGRDGGEDRRGNPPANGGFKAAMKKRTLTIEVERLGWRHSDWERRAVGLGASRR